MCLRGPGLQLSGVREHRVSKPGPNEWHVELVWPSCCMMLYHVERSLVSIKHLMQHRSTFLLFSYMKKKSCTRLVAQLNVVAPVCAHQVISLLRIKDHYSSQITNLHDSSLHSTTYCIRLASSPTPSNIVQLSNVEWYYICLARA